MPAQLPLYVLEYVGLLGQQVGLALIIGKLFEEKFLKTISTSLI